MNGVARRIGVSAGIVFGGLLVRVFPAADCQVAAAERARDRLAANALAAQEMFPQYRGPMTTHAPEPAGVAPRHPVAGATSAPATGPEHTQK